MGISGHGLFIYSLISFISFLFDLMRSSDLSQSIIQIELPIALYFILHQSDNLNMGISGHGPWPYFL